MLTVINLSLNKIKKKYIKKTRANAVLFEDEFQNNSLLCVDCLGAAFLSVLQFSLTFFVLSTLRY